MTETKKLLERFNVSPQHINTVAAEMVNVEVQKEVERILKENTDSESMLNFAILEASENSGLPDDLFDIYDTGEWKLVVHAQLVRALPGGK